MPATAAVSAPWRFVLRPALERLGVTQYTLAKKAGMPPSVVGKLCRPGANPNFLTICRLAQALDLSPGELMAQCQEPIRCA